MKIENKKAKNRKIKKQKKRKIEIRKLEKERNREIERQKNRNHGSQWMYHLRSDPLNKLW